MSSLIPGRWHRALVVALLMLVAGKAHSQEAGTVDSLRAALARLSARLDSLESSPSAVTRAEEPAQGSSGRGVYMNVGFSGLVDAGWSTESAVRELQQGDHDPAVRGFTIPNTELTLDGAVDPYFRGFANLVYKIDSGGETGVELEEAYVLATSLPWNLQLKAGQFFTEFGRQNQQHPHSWSFVDQPLVLTRIFGPEGLRSQGARLSWLPNLPWYTEIMLTAANSTGETAFSFRSEESGEIHGGVPVERSVGAVNDLLLSPRITTSFDLSGAQTVLLGVSAAFGPNNAGAETRTGVYGVDAYWKWKSERAHQGFPFVSWQAEVMSRRYETASRPSIEDPGITLPAEKLKDWGLYSQILWGLKPRWVLGLRGDFVDGNAAAFAAPLRGEHYRISPSLTWYPSEFSKLRLQYNYDVREDSMTDHSLWLQFEFILGAHAAHKF